MNILEITPPSNSNHSRDSTTLCSITLSLDADLAGRLSAAAERNGLDLAEIVLRCLRDHLDGVAAYAHVTDELAAINGHLINLAGLVGEALAEPTPEGLGEICKYRPSKAGRS